jgi:hypothetical protein
VIETNESLTLDDAALSRATEALSAANSDKHFCSEWQEDGVCRICWNVAAEVIRAAEGLRCCSRCNGGAMVAPGDCCPQCGGNGLEPILALHEEQP